MWIFTTDGFFSAVQHRGDPDMIIVRARVREDLERFIKTTIFSKETPGIQEDAGTDYPFRVFVTRDDWQDYVSFRAYKIDYDNFKDAVHDRLLDETRNRAMLAVWSAMKQLQEENR